MTRASKIKPVNFRKADSVETRNVELVKRFYRDVDSGRLDDLGRLFAPKAKIFYESGSPVEFNDMLPLIKTFYTSFPNYQHGIEDIFAAGDKVVARLSYSGTFKNGFMGFDPNGASFKYAGVHIFQLKDGKVSAFWGVEDELGMMTQLGLQLKPRK